MNLEKQLLLEHSKRNTIYIASFIEANPEKFQNLMDLFFSGSYRTVQRSAWVMSECVGKNPGLIKSYWRKLIKNLEKKDLHNAVKRNTLKILEGMEIPPKHHGKLISICFDFLCDKKEPVAVKVFAMSILFTLTKQEPDLQKELRIIIEDQMPFGSPGFKSRGTKILKKLPRNF